MSDTQAIRPVAIPLTSEVDIELQEEVEERKDKALSELQYHDGWLQVKNMILENADALRRHEYPKVAINSKDDFEAIGRKAVVADLTAEILEGVLAQVEAAEVMEDGRATDTGDN